MCFLKFNTLNSKIVHVKHGKVKFYFLKTAAWRLFLLSLRKTITLWGGLWLTLISGEHWENHRCLDPCCEMSHLVAEWLLGGSIAKSSSLIRWDEEDCDHRWSSGKFNNYNYHNLEVVIHVNDFLRQPQQLMWCKKNL